MALALRGSLANVLAVLTVLAAFLAVLALVYLFLPVATKARWRRWYSGQTWNSWMSRVFTLAATILGAALIGERSDADYARFLIWWFVFAIPPMVATIGCWAWWVNRRYPAAGRILWNDDSTEPLPTRVRRTMYAAIVVGTLPAAVTAALFLGMHS